MSSIIALEDSLQPQYSSTSPFLNLPYELRTQIYSELLCPTREHIFALYRAPYGRPEPLDLYPQILCINKQILHEASDLLYSNTCHIDLTSPEIGPSCVDPGQTSADLFLPSDLRSLGSTRKWAFTQDWKLLGTNNKIQQRMFKRLRHIQIIADDRCLWGYGMLGPYWSKSGCILNEILSCLGGDPSEERDDKRPMSKTLDIDLTVMQNKDGSHLLNGSGEWDEVKTKAKETLILLSAVRTTRMVTVEARLNQPHCGITRKLDLDEWLSA